MKHTIQMSKIMTVLSKAAILFLLVGIWTVPVQGQDFILGEDDASDDTYDSSWDNSDNGGFGFGDWGLQDDGDNSGHFIGDSRSLAPNDNGGDINTAGEAFGMFGHSNQLSQAFRDLPRALEEGDVLTFDVSVNFRNGNKGFNLRDSNGDFIANFNVGDNNNDGTETYTLFGNDLFNNNYDEETVFSFTFERDENNDLAWQVDRSGGLGGTALGTNTSIDAGNIAQIEFYVDDTSNDDESNLFFNSLQVTNTEVIRSDTSGDWNAPSTWSTNEVPGAGDEVIISDGDEVTLDTDATIRAIEVESGATFTGSDGTARTLTLTDDDTGTLATRNEATFTNNGTFNASTGTLTFQEAATLTNNDTFNAETGTLVFDADGTLTSGLTLHDIEIGGAVNLGGSTIENSLQIDPGGFARSSPAYGNNATLIYDVGDAYDQTNEWPASDAPPPYALKTALH